MEITKIEMTTLTDVLESVQDADLAALDEVRLSLVGGGCGVATFG